MLVINEWKLFQNACSFLQWGSCSKIHFIIIHLSVLAHLYLCCSLHANIWGKKKLISLKSVQRIRCLKISNFYSHCNHKHSHGNASFSSFTVTLNVLLQLCIFKHTADYTPFISCRHLEWVVCIYVLLSQLNLTAFFFLLFIYVKVQVSHIFFN